MQHMNQDVANFLSLFANMEVACPDKTINLSKGALRLINPVLPSFSDYSFVFANCNDKYGLV